MNIKTYDEYINERAYRNIGLCVRDVLERKYIGRLNENSDSIEILTKDLQNQFEQNPDLVDEGFFSSLIGGAAGMVIGPKIGEAIAHALGITKGILYDMLTSRLVSTALGSSIAKYLADS